MGEHIPSSAMKWANLEVAISKLSLGMQTDEVQYAFGLQL
jgi:hypothetical protein